MAFLLVALGTLYFGLRPFNFLSANDVAASSSGQAALFNASALNKESPRRGISYSAKEIDLGAGRRVSILMEVTPLMEPNGLGVLLTLQDGYEQPPLIIAQWIRHLVIRSRRLENDISKPYNEIGLRNALNIDQPIRLLIASNHSNTRIYVNDSLARDRGNFPLIDPKGRFAGQLFVGNNPIGTQSWHGRIEKMSIYNAFLNPAQIAQQLYDPFIEYIFNEAGAGSQIDSNGQGPDLIIPKRFRSSARKSLSPIEPIDWDNGELRKDAIVNFLGFWPISLLLVLACHRVRWRAATCFLAATLLASCLSLSIENAQVFLPSRVPSWKDFLLNFAGAATAGLIAAIWLWKRGKRQEPMLPPFLGEAIQRKWR